ncbi:MAG TPA: MFS transporter [Thermoleophilaceae bacterium]|nr:MFS transporter [Thermoleophilaceae bacterium]
MGPTIELLRCERRARRFFLAYAQSAIGNGAGYVALVALAYDRWRSPWAITLVLMADFIPAMVLGPVFGALADRWSRRRIAVAADLLRAIAFIGVGLVGGIWATIGFALLAGLGAGLFTPATLAALPSLVDERRVSAATSLYGGLTDGGRVLGPAIAALALPFASSGTIAIANGATFVLSAAVLMSLRFGAAPDRDEAVAASGVLMEAREGVAAVWRMPGVRTLVVASSSVLLFGAMVNVAELLLARSLGAGPVGYAVLVAAYGGGFLAGSLSGAGDVPVPELKRRYLLGIMLIGAGLLVAAIPSFVVAALGLGLAGLGNGVTLVNERIICQRVVPDSMLARAFAVFDTAGSWAFAIAFVGSGALLAAAGTRPVLLIAGLGSLAVWVASKAALRRVWNRDVGEPEPVQPEPEPQLELEPELPQHVMPATVAGRA